MGIVDIIIGLIGTAVLGALIMMGLGAGTIY